MNRAKSVDPSIIQVGGLTRSVRLGRYRQVWLHGLEKSITTGCPAIVVRCRWLGRKFTTEPDGVVERSFPPREELTMSEPHTPARGAPSAEEVKDHVKQTGEETNLGAGNQEPDPATAESPPSDIKAGDEKRHQT